MTERTVHLGFNATPQLAKALRAEAKQVGRSLSSHLQFVLEQRYAKQPKTLGPGPGGSSHDPYYKTGG